MTLPAEEEMTELYDADFNRVDLVKEGANGIPRFLIAKQAEGSRGLVSPDVVRELIGKQAADTEPADAGDERVTVTGTPAAIAKMIHAASQRADSRDEDGELAVSKAAYEAVVKDKYSAGDRKSMASSGAAMDDGSYPIKDEEDLDNAIRAVGRGGASHDAIRRHVISRAKSLGKAGKIPDNWASDGSLKEKVSKDMADMGPDLDEGVDGLDPTVPLAAPEDDQPGDPTDPGSPAWEAIDAATARKWTSIAVRLKNALCIMSEREWLEAASADPDDADAAMDLEDAKCAVEYVIDVLAGFAVTEQAEADLGGEAMEAVGKSAAAAADRDALAAIRKALGGDDKLPGALTTIETFDAVVAKAGRVLSAVNETHIREAAQRLNTVLGSLPQAPATDDSGQLVAKTTPEVEAAMPKPALSEDATQGSGQAPELGTAEPPRVPKPVDEVSKATADPADPAPSDPAPAEVAKADDGGKPPMCVVYDQKGNLIGIVAPDDITPVANSEVAPEDAGEPDSADAADAAPAPAPETPAPPSEVGTPADAVADDGTVTKAATPAAEDEITVTRDVLKSIVADAVKAALDAQAPAEDIAKQGEVAGVRDQVAALEDRLAVVEKHPAAPGVFANGQLPPDGSVPPPRPSQLRGQDQGGQPAPIDVSKALALKEQLYRAPDATSQNELAQSMQANAIAALGALHARGPAR